MTPTPTGSPYTRELQYQLLNILDLMRSIITDGKKELYTKTEVLLLFDAVRSDEELFDREVVIAQQIMATEFEEADDAK